MRKLFSTAVTLLATIPLTLSLQAEPERPNFVVILADDMGWGDSGTYGHPLISFFSSNNGPEVSYGGTTGGLRGGRCSSYGRGIRVPGHHQLARHR